MDINDFRTAVTVLSLMVFIGICWWAFSRKRKSAFHEAANLPFDEDLPAQKNIKNGASDE